MPKKITAYECSFGCGKYLKSYSHIKEHEEKCFYNPKTKSCATCKFNIKYHETYYNPYHGGDPGSNDYNYLVRKCSLLGYDFNNYKNLKTNCKYWKQK